MQSIPFRPLALVMLALAWCPSADAQDDSSRVVLRSGSELDFEGTYRGNVPATQLAPGCVGYVTNNPSYILEVLADGWISIAVEAQDEGDPVLLVRGSGGSICNDDESADTLNPRISTFLTVGEYYVYVGSYAARERGMYSVEFKHSGRSLLPQVAVDRSTRLSGVSGGEVDAAVHGRGCVGTINEQPNHTVQVDQRSFLHIEAVSASDLTLVVESGLGTFCNDDGSRTLNPQIAGWFEPGLVRIYVGSHNQRVAAGYDLTIQPSGQE